MAGKSLCLGHYIFTSHAVIPAHVRYDEELPIQAKLLYAELTALYKYPGTEVDTKYFVDFFRHKSAKKVNEWFSLLSTRGHISYIASDVNLKKRKIYIA